MKRYIECKGLIVEFDLSAFRSANKVDRIRQQENIKLITSHFLTFVSEYVKENIECDYENKNVFKEYVNMLKNTKRDIDDTLRLVKEKE